MVSFLGIRNESFPGSLFPLLAAYFALLVVGTMTFAVLNAETKTTERTENQEAARELFGSGNAVAATASETAAATEPEKPPGGAAKGPGGTVKLAADPTELLYDTKKLSSKPGKVTIDFENPAQIEHDVAVADGQRGAREDRPDHPGQDIDRGRARRGHLRLLLHRPRPSRSGHGRNPQHQIARARRGP